MKRLFFFFVLKVKSIFQKNISFSSRVEYSIVSPKARIWGKCKLFHSSVGDYSYIGPSSRVIHSDIGKYCSIARDVCIGMGDHTLEMISTSPIFTESRNGTAHSWIKQTLNSPYRRVIIGNDVWIGSRAMVLGGLTIGDGAVIGAGAVVTKDVPPYSIVVGVPAKIIRYRFTEDQILELENIKWWNFPENKLQQCIEQFQTSDVGDALVTLHNVSDEIYQD